MPSLVATPGAVDANSFVTAAEYVAYVADRLNLPDGVTTAGEAITDDETRALIEAARDLDALPWPGVPVVGSWSGIPQRLAWPRVSSQTQFADAWGLLDFPAYSPYYFGGAAIPRRLKEAQIELALAYLNGDTPAQVDTNAGVIRKKVDVLETEWEPGARPAGLARYPRVLSLLAPLLGTSGAVVRT
jgi:hypothetical protein